MSNYLLKSQLLNNGVYDFYKNYIRANQLYYLLVSYAYDFPCDLIPYLDYPISKVLSDVEIRECKRIYDAQRARSAMIRKRITSMITQKCIFLTLTFTDDVLCSTNSYTRRRYIVKFLSQFNAPCIANNDYGKENGREHYHAIIQLSHIDYDLYKFGAINGERVVVGEHTDIRIAKYISKLTNHAIKETTKQSRLIYLHMDRLCSRVELPKGVFDDVINNI